MMRGLGGRAFGVGKDEGGRRAIGLRDLPDAANYAGVGMDAGGDGGAHLPIRRNRPEMERPMLGGVTGPFGMSSASTNHHLQQQQQQLSSGGPIRRGHNGQMNNAERHVDVHPHPYPRQAPGPYHGRSSAAVQQPMPDRPGFPSSSATSSVSSMANAGGSMVAARTGYHRNQPGPMAGLNANHHYPPPQQRNSSGVMMPNGSMAVPPPQQNHRNRDDHRIHRVPAPSDRPHVQQQQQHRNSIGPSPSSSQHPRIPRNFAAQKAMLEVCKLVQSRSYVVTGQEEESCLMKKKQDYYVEAITIGQGTFGVVSKALCRGQKKTVALKKILMENETQGFPITALREISILKVLRHPNVTEIVDTCASTKEDGTTEFYLVFAFSEHDLAGILQNTQLKLDAVIIKTMLEHLFQGLKYIHEAKVLHRDMKTSNILVTQDGYLKLADFGLARCMIVKRNEPQLYTNRVVTLWYRPPELLLGVRQYDEAVDTWGAGCIMVEFWMRCAIFQGDVEQQQLTRITDLCGAVTPQSMPLCESYDLYPKLDLNTTAQRIVKTRLRNKAPSMCASAIDIVDKLLVLDPAKRFRAKDVLEHQYFREEPLPLPDASRFTKTLKGSFYESTTRQRVQQRAGNRHAQHPNAAAAARNLQHRPNQQYFDRIY